MKKSLVARGFIGAVASLLGVAAVGCGADVGDGAAGDSAEIGSTSQALTSVSNLSLAMPTGRQSLASCVIDDRGTSKIVAAGGFDLAGTTASDKIEVFTPGTGWATALNSGGSAVLLSQPRGDFRGIQDPSDPHSCYFVGGSTTLNGNAFVASSPDFNVEKLTVDNSGKFSITSSSIGQLARSRHELKACGNVIIAFQGKTSAGAASNSIDYLDVTSPTAWTNITTAVGDSRFDLAVLKDGSNDRFVLGTGSNGTGPTQKIDLLKATNAACTTYSFAANVITVTTSRDGAALVRDPSVTDRYHVAGGEDSTLAPLTSDRKFDVDWTNMTASTEAAGTALSAASYMPIYVQNLSGRDYLLGGITNNLLKETFDTSAVQESLWNTGNLTGSGRVLGSAEVVGGNIYLFGGKETVGADSLLTTTFQITP